MSALCQKRTSALKLRLSNAAIVEVVIALNVHLQEWLIVAPLLIFRQLRAVGVVLTDIEQFERSVAERNDFLIVDHLIGL
jgi:hypothetical protein